MNKVLLGIYLFLGLSFCNIGQELVTNPTSIKWSVIKSPRFKVIFPAGLDSVANQTTNYLEKNYDRVSHSLSAKPTPISIVLQNQGNESNGFVDFVPRRSEFFLTSPQNYSLLGTNDWLQMLAIHEFRHVVQFEKSKSGFNKLVYGLTGNLGLSSLAHLTYPDWFWEGDAVGTETALTNSGRGRIPLFNTLMRANLTDKAKLYNYSKAVGRSFKDNIPNHYVLGYYLTNYIKDKYGYRAWDSTLHKLNKFSLYPFSFSKSIKNLTGRSIDNLYIDMAKDLKKSTLGNIENRKLYESDYLKHNNYKYFTHYEYPMQLPDGSVLALKSGLGHIEQLVKLWKDKPEEKIFELGNHNDGFTLSAANNKVVWTEILPNARWGTKNESILKILDLNTKRAFVLAKGTRLQAPAFNGAGRQIVAVNTDYDGQQSIQILNAESGYVTKNYRFKTGDYYIHPSFTKDDKAVIAIVLNNYKKSLIKINIENDTYETIIEPIDQNIVRPIDAGNYIIYGNAINGFDDIFAYDIKNKTHHQLTYARHGAYSGHTSLDSTQMIFSDYTVNGMRVAKINISLTEQNKVELPEKQPNSVYSSWMKDENLSIDYNDQFVKYEVKKYSKAKLFNVSNWGLLADASDISLNLGVQSQDILSTMTSSAGISVNAFENQIAYNATASYQGLYPIIDFSFENVGRQTTIKKGTLKDQTQDLVDNWRQQSVNLGLRLPFTFFNTVYQQSLVLSSAVGFTQGQDYDLPGRFATSVGKESLQTLTSYISYTRSKKAAKRDVNSRISQSLYLFSRATPFGTGLKSNQYAAQLGLTFPGIGRHDNIRLRGSYLSQNRENEYYFGSPVQYARGYDYDLYDKISVLGIDYRFPLIDPDINIGRFLYIQRIKGAIFSDLSKAQFVDAKGVNQKFNLNSFGLDLSSVFNIMRLNLPIDAGIRIAYRQLDGKMSISPLLLNIPL